MATVDVWYTVPVVVTVDLETGDVDRVRVYDESISAEPFAGYDEDGGDLVGRPDGPILLRQAADLANGADWPAWEVG